MAWSVAADSGDFIDLSIGGFGLGRLAAGGEEAVGDGDCNFSDFPKSTSFHSLSFPDFLSLFLVSSFPFSLACPTAFPF